MKSTEANLERQKALYEKERGNKAYKDEKFDEASKLYSLAISHDKNQPTLFCNRAMAYIKTNKFYEAKLDCDEALNLDPVYTKAYFRRGTCYSKFKDFDRALADFRRVLQLDPENKEAKNSLESLQKLINKGAIKDNLLVEPIRVNNQVGLTSGMRKVYITKRNRDNFVPANGNAEATVATHATSTTNAEITADSVETPTFKLAESESGRLFDQSSTLRLSSMLNEPPKSAFQFLNAWRSMHDQPLVFCNYLLKIQVAEYANVVDSCLEPDLISDILSSYCYYISHCGGSGISTGHCRQIFDSLSALSRLQHFSTNKLFFDDADFDNLRRISDCLALSNISQDDLCCLERCFRK